MWIWESSTTLWTHSGVAERSKRRTKLEFHLSNARIFAKKVPFFLQKWACLKNWKHCNPEEKYWQQSLYNGSRDDSKWPKSYDCVVNCSLWGVKCVGGTFPSPTISTQCFQKGPDFGTWLWSGPMSKYGPEKGPICLSSPDVVWLVMVELYIGPKLLKLRVECRYSLVNWQRHWAAMLG